MNLLVFYKKIRALGIPIFQTRDIAGIFGISVKYGYKLLKKCSDENIIIHLRRGVWAVKELVDPLMVPDYLTAPCPSYISLQSALYYHGLISQIPAIVYALSVARTRRYHTPIGVYSIHHINPAVFCGFEVIGEGQVRMATAEKALFDFFYFKAAKSKLFCALPEVEVPKNFKWNAVKKYTRLVGNQSRQTMISDCFLHLSKPFPEDH